MFEQAIHSCFIACSAISTTRIVLAAIFCFLLAWHSLYNRHSLDTSGAITAFFVGFVTITCGGSAFSVPLFAHFLSSSRLTRVKSSFKQQIDAEYKSVGGSRDFKQVLCNAGLPALAALYSLNSRTHNSSIPTLNDSKAFAFAFAYFSCCAADTWASEIGILQTEAPILITTLRKVPKGTNGGISYLGLIASVCGGLFLGICSFLLVFVTSLSAHTELILFGVLTGLFGSLIDSLLGATLQYSGYSKRLHKVVNKPCFHATKICGHHVLSNNQINLVAASITGVFGVLIAPSIAALFAHNAS